MVNRALWDFAEAAIGQNSEMRWSLSEPIMRRQVTPVFERCASGDLTAEAALDVAVDFSATRVANTLEIFTTLFETLTTRVDIQLHGESLPTLLKIQEFFLGLEDDKMSEDVDWATNEQIARRELYPLFVKVAMGSLSVRDGITVFCDNVNAKRDYYLMALQELVADLAKEIVEAQQHHKEVEQQGTGNHDDV